MRPWSRPMAALLTVLGPALVIYAATTGLSAGDEYQPSETALRFDAMLAAAPPDVIVLGNSVAGTAIDEAQFPRLLGDPPPTVAMMHVPLSRQPMWYAILANRVYRKGYEPKLVLVLDHLESILETQSPSEEARRELLGQMSEQDTLILRKTFQQEDATPAARRLRRGRADARAAVVDHLKWWSVGLLWAPPGPAPLAERGAAVSDEALAGVFGDGTQVDFDLHARVLPVVELDEPESRSRTAATDEAMYLAEIVGMVREHHGNIVFVRVPAPPSNWWANRTDAATETKLVAMLNEHGAGYVDLSAMDLRESDFTDMVHFSGTGRRQMTYAIARAVTELDAMHAVALPRTVTPVRLRAATRVGALPAPSPVREVAPRPGGPCAYNSVDPEWGFLSTPVVTQADARLSSPVLLLEDGEPLIRVTHPKSHATCKDAAFHGPRGFTFTPRGAADADRFTIALSPDFPIASDQGLSTYWVYPGTTATFEIAPPGDWTRGELTATLWADLLGDGATIPELRLDDGAPVALTARGGLARGSVSGTVGTDAWVVTLTSPPDGPYVAVRSVSVSNGTHTRWVVGGPTLEGGIARRVIGAQAGVGQIDRTHTVRAPTFDAVATLDGGRGAFDIAPWKELAPGSLFVRAAIAKCSPFRVEEGGRLLDGLPWQCEDTAAAVPGGLCVDGRTLHFLPVDRTRPASDYTLIADPEHACNQGIWLYPGDTADVTARGIRFRVGPDRLVLTAVPVVMAPPTTSIHVRLATTGPDARVVVDESVPLTDFLTGDVVWDLGERLPPDAVLSLQLRNPADGPFVIVNTAVLAEAAPFDDRDTPGPVPHTVAASAAGFRP